MKSLKMCLAMLTLALAAGRDLPADEPLRRDDRIARRGDGTEYDRDRMQLLHQWADKLASELEYVMEDLSHRNGASRELYQQVDAAMHEVARFQRALRPDSTREHVYRDFQQMDKQIRLLMESSQFTNDPALRSRIARVGYADQQLHQAMSHGDVSETVRSDALARQARALARESRQLAEAARTALAEHRRAEPLLGVINQFAEEAAHFDQVVEKNASPKHVLRDFATLDQSWQNVVVQINQSGRNAYLFRRTERVNTIHNQLHTLLEAQTARTPLEYRLEH